MARVIRGIRLLHEDDTYMETEHPENHPEHVKVTILEHADGQVGKFEEWMVESVRAAGRMVDACGPHHHHSYDKIANALAKLWRS